MYTARDIRWIKTEYGLSVADDKITGRLRFSMAYNRKTGDYTLNPPPSQILDSNTIHHVDEYDVEIVWPSAQQPFPDTIEKGDKIAKTAALRGLATGDLHTYPSGTLCLASPQELSMSFNSQFSLQVYVDRYLVPFLFLQTHFRLNNEWAWQTAGHRTAGIFGWHHLHAAEHNMADAKSETLKRFKAHLVDYPDEAEPQLKLLRKLRKSVYKGHMPCLCGSPQRIRTCHPETLYGVNTLRKEVITHIVKTVDAPA